MTATVDPSTLISNKFQGTSPATFPGVSVAIPDLRHVIAVVMAGSSPPPAVVYGGNGYNFLGHNSFTSSGTSDVSWWYLDNPTVGSASLVISSASSFVALAYASIPIMGVDLNRVPVLGTGAGAVSTAPACNASGSPGPNDVSLAAMLTRATSITPPGGNQINLATQNVINTLYCASFDQILGVNAGTFSWTTTSTDWTAQALTIYGLPTYNLESAEYF